MRRLNLSAAVVTATTLGGACFRLVVGDGVPTAWSILFALASSALVWALVFGTVRDGVRATTASLRR